MEAALVRSSTALRRGQHEVALLAAKDALEASGRTDARPWIAMANALSVMGDVETAYSAAAKGRQQCRHSQSLDQCLSNLLEQLVAGRSQQMQARRLRSWEAYGMLQQGVPRRVLCLSDLHVDQGDNLNKLQQIHHTAFKQDVLIVAGDVADTFAAVRSALQLLKERFARVVLVPGNHDLWLRPGLSDDAAYPDSVCKLLALNVLCDELGVDVSPVQVCEGLVIVPLLSWYHYSFDVRDPKPGTLRFDSFCRWPVVEQEGVWQLMLALNRPSLAWVAGKLQQQQQQQRNVSPVGAEVPGAAATAQGRCSHAHDMTIITVSHFLPSPELPFNNYMSPEEAKAVGCLQLRHQLDLLGSHIHVHGHTHVPTTMQLPGKCLAPAPQITRTAAVTPAPSQQATTSAAAATLQQPDTADAGSSVLGADVMVRGGSSRLHVHQPLDGVSRPCLMCVWDSESGRQAVYKVDLFTGARMA